MESDAAWWGAALVLAPRLSHLTESQTRRLGWQLIHDDLLGCSDLERLAARQGFVVTREQVRSSGVRDSTVRRMVRNGMWSTPYRGVVCPLPTDPGGRPGGSSPEIYIAAAALARPGCVISHASAARLHGLAVLHRPPRVRLTTTSVSRAGGWATCHVHAARLPSSERNDWFGVAVTSPARTVVDLARLEGAASGLVVADSGLFEGALTIDQIRRSVRRARRRPGVVAAARVADLAAIGAESPLESLTRLCLIDGGITEIAALQACVPTARGEFRVDLLFRDRRVIVEADGRLKYQLGDALWREKLRQEALERAGFTVVRVTWADVGSHPAQTVARVRQALDRATVR